MAASRSTHAQDAAAQNKAQKAFVATPNRTTLTQWVEGLIADGFVVTAINKGKTIARLVAQTETGKLALRYHAHEIHITASAPVLNETVVQDDRHRQGKYALYFVSRALLFDSSDHAVLQLLGRLYSGPDIHLISPRPHEHFAELDKKARHGMYGDFVNSGLGPLLKKRIFIGQSDYDANRATLSEFFGFKIPPRPQPAKTLAQRFFGRKPE